jgi:hypothetical protein
LSSERLSVSGAPAKRYSSKTAALRPTEIGDRKTAANGTNFFWRQYASHDDRTDNQRIVPLTLISGWGIRLCVVGFHG